MAKRTGTKVSAQWSNEEAVHQILVDLLTAEESGELLRKVWVPVREGWKLIVGSD